MYKPVREGVVPKIHENGGGGPSVAWRINKQDINARVEVYLGIPLLEHLRISIHKFLTLSE